MRMKWMVWALIGVMAVPVAAQGMAAANDAANDAAVEAAGKGYRPLRNTSESHEVDGKTVGFHSIYHLTVTPAVPTTPLLARRLDYASYEMTEGNAAPLYSQAHAELDRIQTEAKNTIRQSKEWLNHMAANPGASEREDTELRLMLFRAMPRLNSWGWGWAYASDRELADEKEKAARERFNAIPDTVYETYYESTREVWETLQRASRMRECNWSYTREWRGVATLLPEVQNQRELARYLQEKAKWEMRKGRLEDARRTLRVSYMLGTHTASDPSAQCLVTSLVGIAIRGIAHSTAIELFQQPDSPNLYWSIALLTENPLRLGSSMEGELSMFFFDPQKIDTDRLRNSDTMSSAELRRVAEMFTTSLIDINMEFQNFDAYAGTSEHGVENEQTFRRVFAAIAVLAYPDAAKRLRARGLSDDEIEQLDPYQVVVPYVVERVLDAYDLIRCADYVNRATAADAEYAERFKSLADLSSRYDATLRSSRNVVDVFVAMLTPAMQAAGSAERRIAAMDDANVIIEALRWHAAENGGKLPDSLDEITVAPIPRICRTTGKTFTYQLDGETAELHVPAVGVTFIYRVTVEK